MNDLAFLERKIHLWHVPILNLKQDLGILCCHLQREEQIRAKDFVFADDRERYIASHFALRKILAGYLRVPPLTLGIYNDSYGKPFISNSCIRFNLSHSGDTALVAITRDREIGVDIEQERPGWEVMALAEQFFSHREVTEIKKLPLSEQTTAFFRCWTRKEAYIKAIGRGLSIQLDSFSVPVKESCHSFVIMDTNG